MATHLGGGTEKPMSLGSGARRLSQFRNQKICVECLRCQLRRRYDGAALYERAGDCAMPDLLTRIAVGLGCDLNISPTPNGRRCGLHYA